MKLPNDIHMVRCVLVSSQAMKFDGILIYTFGNSTLFYQGFSFITLVALRNNSYTLGFVLQYHMIICGKVTVVPATETIVNTATIKGRSKPLISLGA